jgi:hypothetical protein
MQITPDAAASNVFVLQRALDFHAAARHVLRLACEQAVMRGALRPDDAQALQFAARHKMHTAQVRCATELVFDLSHAAALAHQHAPKLLPDVDAVTEK